MKIKFRIVSRKKGYLRYNELSESIIKSHHLIINTTPLGMYPNVKASPEIPYDGLFEKHILFDLIYNPKKTLFLKEGEKRGCLIKNGYEMLVIQAEKAWAIWNQMKFTYDDIRGRNESGH